MIQDTLASTLELEIKDTIGKGLVDRIDIAEDVDHDGQEALFVTILYRPGIGNIDQSAISTAVRDRLLASGERRFAYINHIYPDDPLADDGEAA